MSNKKITIGILETGRPPAELTDTHGNYPRMFKEWLAPFDADFKVYAALDGILPDSPTDCDLWVVTGSRFGAYENHAWIGQLADFIRNCRDAKTKMIGICFGHQIIAQALGGTVVKSDKGWGLGVHEYETQDWPGINGGLSGGLKIQAYHQDQVSVAPEGSVTIAQSEFCEFAALWYPGFALTVQGHPEMPGEFARDLLLARRGTVLDADMVDAAMEATKAATTDNELAVFIRDNLASI